MERVYKDPLGGGRGVWDRRGRKKSGGHKVGKIALATWISVHGRVGTIGGGV